ncbi:MAG: hypothetical protein WBG10_16755 [Pseudolabrys sp.]
MIGGHALALATVLAAVAAALTGAPIFAQQQQATDMKLVDAGFKTRVAINPAEVARLRNYPSRTMFVRTKGGVRRYYYVDPDNCQCFFVGNEDAFKTYRDMITPAQALPGAMGNGSSPGNTIIQEMNADVEPDYMMDDNYF